MTRLRINEGDWFAVPLRTGGYGVGVVARKGRKGGVFGYFFGPKHEQLPTMNDVRALHPMMASFYAQFGDLGIRRGEWPILGRLEPWNRSEWPMPVFGRIDDATGLAWVVRYPDENPDGIGESQRCSMEEARRLEQDGAFGYGAIELLLTDKLTK